MKLPPVRDLPIFWKLLLPFLVLVILVGSGGSYIVIRDLSRQSAAALGDQLTLRAVKARSLLHERELQLLDATNYASNLRGMAEAVASRDTDTVGSLLESVLALKGELAVVAAVDAAGSPIAEFRRASPDVSPELVPGANWQGLAPVRRIVGSGDGRRLAWFAPLGEEWFLVIGAPICRAADPCTPVGATIVGFEVADVARHLAATQATEGSAPQHVTLFDPEARPLAASGPAAPSPQLPLTAAAVQQQLHEDGGRDVATAYLPFTLDGQPGGVLGVTIAAETAFESVGPATARLVGLIAVAMVLAIAFGIVLSRLILRQLSLVVRTARELGSGELSARAEVLAGDEHGELAAALNTMAEQLQASHETLELHVEQRTEEIRRLLRDRTEFFAGLSHELRTPLAVVITQAEMVANDAAHLKGVGAAGQAIGAAASQLLDLVNDILELARAEADSLEVDLVPVELPEIISDAGPMLTRLAASAGIELTMHLPPRVPKVVADPARLRDVLVNLVDNAIKYTPAGGRIDVTVTRTGHEVGVGVADTGVGIPPDEGDRVFEPFYRVSGTSPQHEQASSGLGLALSRRWVEAHGGTLTWQPRPGGGTVFSFTVPRHRQRGSRANTNGARTSTVTPVR